MAKPGSAIPSAPTVAMVAEALLWWMSNPKDKAALIKQITDLVAGADAQTLIFNVTTDTFAGKTFVHPYEDEKLASGALNLIAWPWLGDLSVDTIEVLTFLYTILYRLDVLTPAQAEHLLLAAGHLHYVGNAILAPVNVDVLPLPSDAPAKKDSEAEDETDMARLQRLAKTAAILKANRMASVLEQSYDRALVTLLRVTAPLTRTREGKTHHLRDVLPRRVILGRHISLFVQLAATKIPSKLTESGEIAIFSSYIPGRAAWTCIFPASTGSQPGSKALSPLTISASFGSYTAPTLIVEPDLHGAISWRRIFTSLNSLYDTKLSDNQIGSFRDDLLQYTETELRCSAFKAWSSPVLWNQVVPLYVRGLIIDLPTSHAQVLYSNAARL